MEDSSRRPRYIDNTKMTDQRHRHQPESQNTTNISSDSHPSFSSDWSTYERNKTANSELRKVGILPFTVPRNPLMSKGASNTPPNSTINSSHNSINSNRAWISRHVSPAHAPPIQQQQATTNHHSSSSSNNNNNNNNMLQHNMYKSCMMNKPPTIRIPDEEATSLNPQQRLVIESVLSGYNTFFTGPAGSGKSHILDYILKINQSLSTQEVGGGGGRMKKKNIVITATTGLAACNIGGVTIHSFAGVGTGDEPLANMITRVTSNEYTKQRWRDCDMLIIDEISMMPAEFLDKLAIVASRARNDRRPFGGIQLVVCGDFFQLPPVNIEKNKFAFEAEIWAKVITTSVCLTTVFRQNKDPTLVKILNEARIGELSLESMDTLRRHGQRSLLPPSSHRMVQHHSKKNDNHDDHHDDENKSAVIEETTTQATKLECKNAIVDRLNKMELDKLPGETYTYKAKDTCLNKMYEGQLKSGCQAPEVLELKVGATVMLLKNLDPARGLVNGIRGVVVRFQKESLDPDGYPPQRQSSKREEVPVIRFESLKRRTNPDQEGDEEDEPKIVEIKREEFSNKIGDVEVSSRKQIPLRLGYALTIHKSQGMTIPDLVVNLTDTFEYGQAYVAISRATCLDKLILKGFKENQFIAHPKVSEFYRLLESTQGISPSSSIGQAMTSDGTDIGLIESKRKSDDTLTDDQRRRIDENRKRALLLRQEREKTT